MKDHQNKFCVFKIFGTGSDSEIQIVGHICLILYREPGGATGVTENQGGATGVTENQGGATGATREPGGCNGCK